jgi:MoxR-like ATPase
MKFMAIKPGKQEHLASWGDLPKPVHVFDLESIQALNAALAARRPLLVRGEPGIGKSQLARAAAKNLGRAYIQYVVDARTESRDLLWHFDAVARLAEAQLCGALGENTKTVRQRLSVENYIRPGPLWWAFAWEDAQKQAQKVNDPAPDQPDGGDPQNGCVVLVDEIDKAETDVPNGLLEAMGMGQFTPLGRKQPVIAAGVSPLVVITTNEERALPDAFVRRCLVLYLTLPKQDDALIELLVQRGRAHFDTAEETVLRDAAQLLAKDRKKAQEEHWLPLPGQAEYLDLVRAVLALAPDDPDKQRQTLEKIAQYTLRKHRGSPV